MDTRDAWSVPNSDDERDKALLVLPENGCQDLPVKILKYYQDIEKNKVLELSVKEFRKSLPQEDVDEENVGGQEEVEEKSKEEEETEAGLEDGHHGNQLQKTNEPSAFDYLEEPDKCQGQIPRRIPKIGRLPKKRVGTLKNVISNLKRYKELDSSTNEEPKQSTEENKSDVEENKDEQHKDDAADSENT